MNLETKKMTPAQLGLLVMASIMGVQLILNTNQLGNDADQFLWLSVLLSGMIYFGAAYMMLRVCTLYPEDTIVEIALRVAGKTGGAIILMHLFILLVVQAAVASEGLSDVIHLFMFDRTPTEVLCLLFFGAVLYCSIQDWDTILQVVQVFTLTELPLMFGIYLLCILSFDPENLLPLWPDKPLGVIKGVVHSYNSFSGYEVIYILLPAVARKSSNLVTAMAWGMGIATAIYVIIAVIIIGAITAGSIKVLSYPILTALKQVEIPGTFIERIENYMVLSWVPIVVMSVSITFYTLAEICRRTLGFRHHRIFVPMWMPIVFLLTLISETPKNFTILNDIVMYAGLSFSFVTTPILWFLARREVKRSG